MQDKPQNIDKLFQKHQHQFDKMPSDNAWNRLENMLNQTDSATAEAKKAQAEPQSLAKTTIKSIETAKKPSRPMWRYIVAAMLLLTFLSIGGYLTNQLSNDAFLAEKTMQSGSKNVAANAVQKSKSQKKTHSEEIKNKAKSVVNKAVQEKEVTFKETAKTSAIPPPILPPPVIEEVEDEITEMPQYLSDADAKDTDIPSPVIKEIVEEEPPMATEDEESDDLWEETEEIAETEIAFEEVVEEIVEEEKSLVEDSINIGATSDMGATGATSPTGATGATGANGIEVATTRSEENATKAIPQDVIELKNEESYNLDDVSVLNEAQGMSKKARKAKRNKDKKARSESSVPNPYMDNSGNAFNSTVLQWDWLAGDWTSTDGDKELNVMPSSQAGLKINEFSSQNGDAVLARVLDIQETANGVTLRIQYLAQEYKNQAAIAFFNEESQANTNKLQFVDDSGKETKTIRVEQVDNQTIKWEEINGGDIKTILFQKR